jgi:hypothetical protein
MAVSDGIQLFRLFFFRPLFHRFFHLFSFLVQTASE